MKQSTVIITVYSHPEYYPPTLSMIIELSKRYNRVVVYSRNVLDSKWIYPDNVYLYTSGKRISIRETESKSVFLKMVFFLNYTLNFFKLLVKERPSLVVLCDSIPTLAFYLLPKYSKCNINLWYHNHDVLVLRNVRRFSIAWFSWYSERALFGRLSIFTLPSEDRRVYFPINNLKGQFYFLPNFPHRAFFSNFPGAKSLVGVLRLIFQGEISEGHGIEEIIRILPQCINNKDLELHLIGRISVSFKSKLVALGRELDCLDSIIFYEPVNYHLLPSITQNCQIGIAIYTKDDVMNRTIGTASNKFYEYISLGLPVLMFSDSRFESLSTKSWALPTNLISKDLIDLLTYADSNYDVLSKCAREDANSTFHYEIHFNKIFL